MSLLGSIFQENQDSRAPGEPKWMPAPDVVARARLSLERRGAIQSLRVGSDGTQIVPPGQTPWQWWAFALAWVVIWPALIALRIGGSIPGRAPLWMMMLLAILHMLALAGPVFYSERATSRSELRRRFGKIRTLAELLALEPAEFESWVAMLFQLMGYMVKNTQEVADHGIDLLVTDDRAQFGLVQCKRYRGSVGEPVVRDLYGTLMHERADCGWVVTTGAVSRQAREWASGKPIELWDGPTLVDLARRHR